MLMSLVSWYKRNELGLRLALFSSANQVSGAVAGLLAVRAGALCGHPKLKSHPSFQAAISKMNGIGGKPAW